MQKKGLAKLRRSALTAQPIRRCEECEKVLFSTEKELCHKCRDERFEYWEEHNEN